MSEKVSISVYYASGTILRKRDSMRVDKSFKVPIQVDENCINPSNPSKLGLGSKRCLPGGKFSPK
jgi:hypothetical protein